MAKSNKGISIIESLVCIVIIGIGFIAIMQLSAFSINSMDRATERNKLNYLSEMVMEDMMGDPDNVSKYGNFNLFTKFLFTYSRCYCYCSVLYRRYP